MSHILFGDFKSDYINKDLIEKLRKEVLKKGVLFHFKDEINFYNDVNRMIQENVNINNNTFCITSVNQKYNSDDLLFPYDKYTDEELFPNTEEDRTQFEKLCCQNIMILKNGISKMRELLQTQNLRVFIVEGYDDNFSIIKCSEDEMFQDILKQVINSFNLKPKIYEIS